MRYRCALVSMGAVVLATACSPRPEPPGPAVPSAIPAPQAAEQETLTGWFHTITNGEPHHYLVTENGGSIRLVLGESFVSRYGDPSSYTGKRVRLTGIVEAPSGRRLRVISLVLDG